MSTSNSFYQRSLQVAPGGVHSPVRAFKSVGGTPIFFKKAEGPYLYDVEGRKFVDFCMSFGPLLLGHRNAEVQSAVEEMVGTAWSFGACEPYSLALAEWVKSQLPMVERMRFTSSGTEACMSALRVARAVTGRSKILKFNGCYHGHADHLLVKAGSGLAGEAVTDSAGVPASWASETLVCDLDNTEQFDQILHENKGQIAAIILEPLPANYGLLKQRPEFLQHVATETKKAGALLIWDEVISGFRVGLRGMAGELGVQPDLLCYGKVLGGGFPVGAYAGRAEYMNWVAPAGPVYQAGTLSANPIGMTAGLKTLQVASRLNAWSELANRARDWKKALEAEWANRDIPLEVSIEGSLFWIHRRNDKPVRTIAQIDGRQAAFYREFFHALVEKGIYLAPSGYEVGFLSLAHSPELLRSLVPIFGAAAVQARGHLE